MEQQALWYDTPEDALRATVEALSDPQGRKGLKAIGAMLWPAKPPADAGRYLAHCVDQSRAEKLSEGERLMLMRMAREQGIWTYIDYIAQSIDIAYTPISREDKAAQLQRDFIAATKALRVIQQQMEALT